MLTLGYWLPFLIFVGVCLLAWFIIKGMAAESEQARQKLMENEQPNKNGPDPKAHP